MTPPSLNEITSRYIFTLPMQVRDYELDSQGIVNNAIYLHYMEHTRHEFCRSAGMSFSKMSAQGFQPVLAKAEIEYKTPLCSGEHFISCLNLSRKGPLFVFQQDLYTTTGTPVIKARMSIACLENGHLTKGDALASAFGQYLT